MNATGEQHRTILQRIARRVMLERGLLPDFSAEVLTELGRIQPPATTNGGQVRDKFRRSVYFLLNLTVMR